LSLSAAARRFVASAATVAALIRAFDAVVVIVGAVSLLGLLIGVISDTRLEPRPSPPPAPMAAPAKVDEAERDSALRVRVVTAADQRPVSGALVRVFWEQRKSYFDAGKGTTDDEGKLTVTRVPRGRIWVLAEADGLARASTQLLAEGGERDVSLELAPAARLAVRVTDEAHAPLPGATVLVTSADPLPFGALTDSSGLALLARLGKGPFNVKASAPGYESVTRSGVRGEVELALRRLGSLLVHVKHTDGSVAVGATVEIGGATLWPARSAQTDATGSCKISGLLAGSYDLRASQGSLVSRVLMGTLLTRGENAELTLVLEQGRFVTALVTDGEGTSPHLVAGADVVLAEEGLSSFPLRGRSGTDGKVTLGPISSGPATLSGRAPDFIGNAVVAVPDPLPGAVELPLVRGGTLKGEVVDARGFPIDGASVEIVGEDRAGLPISETPQLLRFRRSHFSWALAGPRPLIAAGELGVMPGPIPPIPGSNAALGAAAVDAAFEPLDPEDELVPWATGGDGRFRAAPVTPGRVRALVRHPDFVEGISDAVTLTPGGEASVKLTLLRGGSLEGRVRDERDQPVAGAEVEIIAERGTFQRTTITASDGSFAFSALPREVTLNLRRAENPSRIAKRVPLTVKEGERQTLDVVLPALRESLAVSVVDAQGEALELAEVNVLSLDPASPLRTTAFSDAQGKLEVADARGLPLRVTAQAPGFVRQVLTLRGGEVAIELRLERGVLVQGRVTALRGRRAVSGAQVTLSSQGAHKTATTDADGVYRFADIAPGPVHLHVSQAELADAEFDASVTRTARDDRACELPDVDLDEPGAVEGEVVDERGDPVAGARVAVDRAPSYLPSGPLPRGVAITDTRGAFALRGLASGPRTIEAFAPDRGRGSAQLEVQSNRTHPGLRITLKPSGSLPDPFAPAGVAVTLGERGQGAALEVVVVAVAEGSEAERAGLAAGDVITAIDDARPSSMHEARSRLGGAPRSDVVLSVLRAGAAQRLSVMREPVRK
jgi:protocatechuate 3,4-dioxygenase beta subunit